MGNWGNNNSISIRAMVHPDVIMGNNNIIKDGAIIRSGVQMGDGNVVGPYCVIGEPAEKHGYFDIPGKVLIGDNNRFSKQVTIDSSTEGLTIIRDNVIMLKNAHVGHDARIESGVILSCNVCIGGHTIVGEHTNFGLGAVAHQRVEVKDHCMVGMNSTITKTTAVRSGRKLVGSPARDIGPNDR